VFSDAALVPEKRPYSVCVIRVQTPAFERIVQIERIGFSNKFTNQVVFRRWFVESKSPFPQRLYFNHSRSFLDEVHEQIELLRASALNEPLKEAHLPASRSS
jgi:hypothetical protein